MIKGAAVLLIAIATASATDLALDERDPRCSQLEAEKARIERGGSHAWSRADIALARAWYSVNCRRPVRRAATG